jgi:hypothetical protein
MVERYGVVPRKTCDRGYQLLTEVDVSVEKCLLFKNKPPMAFHALRIEIDARRDEMGHVLLRDVAEHGEERGDGKHVLWSLNSAVERESVTM